jgi:serine/threonine protein kinase
MRLESRMARFSQEARLLAALNHPNIAAIYGLEEAQDGGPGRAGRIQFLVLELVPGETLAEEEVSRSQIHVVQNWSETLRRRAAASAD